MRVREVQRKHPKMSFSIIINNLRKAFYPDEKQKSLYTRYNELLNNDGQLGKLANIIKNLETE